MSTAHIVCFTFLVMAGVAACDDGTDPCPDVLVTQLQNGAHTTLDQEPWSDDDTFAHGPTEKQLHVDLKNNIVTITYERDGKSIVETWSINSRTSKSWPHL